MQVQFNNNIDDLFKIDETNNYFTQSKVTIAMQKRNGKKCITTITGLADDLDLKRISSHIKKTYSCNGAVTKDEKFGEIITLSGDQRENFYNFLISEDIYKADDIIVKGS
jgi:translation initiation factor 1